MINIGKALSRNLFDYYQCWLHTLLSGRFGNQADHYLGAIAFAKGLDRTLILPPWVEYHKGEPRSDQVPFAHYFNVSIVAEYHRVIPMEEFMETLADEIWPQEKRVAFCYGFRKGPVSESCNAKDGNPFGPFWDTFNIEFDRSEAYGPLHYDVHNTEVSGHWNRRYPPAEYPVLAFTGAPASYPVQAENVMLSKYLVYNDEMVRRGDAFIRENLAHGPFIAVHLRNGPDWVSGDKRGVDTIRSLKELFALSSGARLRARRQLAHTLRLRAVRRVPRGTRPGHEFDVPPLRGDHREAASEGHLEPRRQDGLCRL